MKTSLQLEISFAQLLELVKQLPPKQKTKLTEVLEEDLISDRLKNILKAFKTYDLSIEVIDDEVEAVRRQIHEN